MGQPSIYFVAVPLIIFLAYLMFGISGFGASLISVPLLTQMLPLDFVLPLCVLLDFVTAMTLGKSTHTQVDRQEIRRLLPFVLVGTLIGVSLLIQLPRHISLLCLGAFITAYGTYSLLNRGSVQTIGTAWSGLAGLMSGIGSALFGIGGPAYVIYLARRIQDKSLLRATIARMATINICLRLAALVVSGLLFQKKAWLADLLLMPVALAGLWAGHQAHARLKGANFSHLVNLLLVLSGISVLARAIS